MNSLCLITKTDTPNYYFSTAKVMSQGTPVFLINGVTWWRPSSIKEGHKGYFGGLFGIRLGRFPGIIPEKFYSSLLYFLTNALALRVNLSCVLLLINTSEERLIFVPS